MFFHHYVQSDKEVSYPGIPKIVLRNANFIVIEKAKIEEFLFIRVLEKIVPPIDIFVTVQSKSVARISVSLIQLDTRKELNRLVNIIIDVVVIKEIRNAL